jgi:hypothetical protein
MREDSLQQIEEAVRRIVREELENATIKTTGSYRLAVSIADAGPLVGYSRDTIRQAVARGDLVPSYANSKAVIMVEELERWARTLPAEDPREVGRRY